MARSFLIIFCVAYSHVDLVQSQDNRGNGEVCNSGNMMQRIIHEVKMEDGNDSGSDRNDSSVGDILTELIQHVGANSTKEPESFFEISRALKDQVQSLKAYLSTEHDGQTNERPFQSILELLSRKTENPDFDDVDAVLEAEVKSFVMSSGVTTCIAIPSFPSLIQVMNINGWIVFQQRIDGSLSFNRTWSDYMAGFGSISANFWLGLEKIYQLTAAGSYWLRMEMLTSTGQWYSVEYSAFHLDSVTSQYTLHATGYSGDAGDVINPARSTDIQNGMPFSTYDRDNDDWSGNCARYHGGGFWYNACFNFNLNGRFYTDFSDLLQNGAMRGYIDGNLVAFSTSRMMMKLK